MPDSTPILSVIKFWYADAYRTLRKRVAGACTSLLNFAPNEGETEKIRRGYSAYSGIKITNAGSGYTSAPTVSFTGGAGSGAAATAVISEGTVVDVVITSVGTGYTSAPTVSFSGGGGTGAAATAQLQTGTTTLASGITQVQGMQKHFFLPVQSPSQDDVLLQMASTGVFLNPYWRGGGTKDAQNTKINETKSFTGVAGSVAANVLTITGSDALGLSSTTDYYRGWVLKNTTQTEYAYVVSYAYSSAASGTSTFTVTPTLTSDGLNWLATNAYILYRNFHDNLTFAPAYNNNLTSPPFALADVSRLYFSGGQSSAAGNVALWSAYIDRDFFPSSVNTFTYTGTYVSEERLRAPSGIWTTKGVGNFGTSGLETDKTYWIAFAYVYDGFQIGELLKYETVSDYLTAGAWTKNYLRTSAVTDGVASVTVTAAGSNYVNAGVTFTGGAGSGATATANLSGNTIASVNVTNGGTGYTSAPTVGFTSGVKEVTISVAGTGYSAGAFVTFTGGGGTGAFFTVLTVNGSGGITSVAPINYGTGYTSAPTPVISGAGSGATLVAVVGSGATATSSLSTSTTENQAIGITLGLNPATTNKRITGICMFAAQDSGQTTVRQNAYHFIRHIPIDTADTFGLTWRLTSSGTFSTEDVAILFDGEAWEGRVGTYIDASGMEETPPDTSYSYSSRLVLNDKHYISNVYISSEAVTNREEIFTNPRGGLAGVNSGVNQPSLFPNDVGFFRKGIELAIGTKINCMAKVGLGELLTIKDRGLILNRIIEEVDGTIQLISKIIDQNVGCSTLNGFTQLDADDGGLIFFAGYEDVYIYENGNFKRLIERKDQQDWLYQYRTGISKSSKESIVVSYLPEGVLLVDIAQTAGQQYQLYTQYIPDGWRQVAFKQTSGFASTVFFNQFSKLQNGTIIGLSTESPATLYQFSNATTGVYYYTDAGTSIRYNLNTGDVVPSGSEAFDTVFDGYEVGRYAQLPMQGTLNAIITKDVTTVFTERTSLDKTSEFLEIPVRSDEPQTGNSWGLQLNSNTSSPEVLNAGNDFRLTGIYYYGHFIPREKRPSEASGGTVVSPPIGTIGGAYEFLITSPNAWETKIFDQAFTGTYSSLDGDSASPTWRMAVYTARTATGTEVAQADILFRNITLSGFDVRSPEELTLCKYGITHI